MSLNASWAPPGETVAELIDEHSILVETWLESMLFGAEVLLYLMTVHRMITRQTMKDNPRSQWSYIVFITIQLILVTFGIAGNIQETALAFVWNRNFPGGPVFWQYQFNNLPVSFLSLASFTVSTWMQDGFLLYRFLVIWHSVGGYLLSIIPVLAFLTSLAFSLVLLVSEGTNPANIQNVVNLPLALVFFSTSVGLNAILTALICLRIWLVKRRVGGALGDDYASMYASIMSMLVESAGLYSIVGIAFIIAFGTNNGPAAASLSGVYGVMTAFAPTLIAFKVSRGEAWTKETGAITSMQFAPNQTRTTMTRSTRTAVPDFTESYSHTASTVVHPRRGGSDTDGSSGISIEEKPLEV